MSNPKASSQNILFNEVRNLSSRLNEFQREFGETVQVLQEAALSSLIDVEQLVKQVQQMKTKLDYVEELLKAVK